MVRRESRDAKTKAGRKSGCEIDRKVGQQGREGGREAVSGEPSRAGSTEHYKAHPGGEEGGRQ